jgi:hypothetical protein
MRLRLMDGGGLSFLKADTARHGARYLWRASSCTSSNAAGLAIFGLFTAARDIPPHLPAGILLRMLSAPNIFL